MHCNFVKYLACFILVGGALSGCEAEPEPIVVDINAWCEGTTPLHCMLPWPSDRWLVDDASTDTGKRLNLSSDAIPRNTDDDEFDVSAYNIYDGFSPATAMLTVFPTDVDVTTTPGLAVEGSWDLSLSADSPTVLIDLESGERIAHMVEIDARAHEDDVPGLGQSLALLYIRPAVRLLEARRYGVGIRGIKLIDGSDAVATGAFAALRDDTPTTSASLESRRDRYEDLFSALQSAGVERDSLVQAWSFTTASSRSIRGDLLTMRDDALTRVPVGAGSCTVEEVVEDETDDRRFRRIDGTFSVPLYMDRDGSGARVVRGDDGLPAFQGWAEAPFTLTIPRTLSEEGSEPGRLLGYGHGLMGSAGGEGGGTYVQQVAQEFGYVVVATDWQGMSDRDLVTVGTALSNVSTFPKVGDRLKQGVINHLVMVRSFKGACRDLPELQVNGRSVIDDGAPYWMGISQGGIMGPSVLALSPDIPKAAFLVGGISYPLMIGRSVDFYEYEVIFRTWYPERIDREILMNMMSTLWDGAEAATWMPHLVSNPLPGVEAKQVLYQVARLDSQVPNIASELAVRTMGIPQLAPAAQPIWGITDEEAPLSSALVYFDFGVEPLPAGNLAPEDDNGTHGDQRYTHGSRAQINAFFQEGGLVQHFCEGPCDPE